MVPEGTYSLVGFVEPNRISQYENPGVKTDAVLLKLLFDISLSFPNKLSMRKKEKGMAAAAERRSVRSFFFSFYLVVSLPRQGSCVRVMDKLSTDVRPPAQKMTM